MAKIIIPSSLRRFTNNQSVFESKGDTVEEAIQDLTNSFHDLHQYLFDPSGKFRSFIRIFIGNTEVNDMNVKIELERGTVISIIPAIAGG